MLMTAKPRISIVNQNGSATIVVPPRRHAVVIGITLLTSVCGVAALWVGVQDIIEFGLGAIFTWETGGMFVLGPVLLLSFWTPLWSIFGKEKIVIQGDTMIRTRTALVWRNQQTYESKDFKEASWIDGPLQDFTMIMKARQAKSIRPVAHLRFKNGDTIVKICEGTSQEEGEQILEAFANSAQGEHAS